jgi:hypothetical protein
MRLVGLGISFESCKTAELVEELQSRILRMLLKYIICEESTGEEFDSTLSGVAKSANNPTTKSVVLKVRI